MEGSAFFPKVLTLVVTCKLRFVKRRLLGQFIDVLSQLIAFNGFHTQQAAYLSHVGWLYPAKHGKPRQRSSAARISRFAVSAVLVDFVHLAKLNYWAQTTPEKLP